MSIQGLRRLTRTLIILAGLSLTACGVLPKDNATFSVYRGLPYVDGGHHRQVADLFVPANSRSKAAVIVIHGGSWSRGEPGDMQKYVDRFVDRGYVVMNISYRLAPEHRHPAQVDDARAAYRWLVSNARNYQIDPNRIAVMGYSAGAHLAMMLGLQTAPDLPPVAAVIAGAGPTDMSVYPESPYLETLIGGSGHDYPARYRDASPLAHVTPDAPPMLLYHGTWDRLVEFDQSAKMAQALAEANTPHQLVELPMKGHITAFVFDQPAWTAMDDFLALHLAPPQAQVRPIAAGLRRPAPENPDRQVWL